MKKFSAKTVASVMSFTLFALCMVDCYLYYKTDIEDSIARLKTTLKPAEKAEGASEASAEDIKGDTANGQEQ